MRNHTLQWTRTMFDHNYNVVRIERAPRGAGATDAYALPVLGMVPTTVRRISGTARRCATDDTARALRDVRRALGAVDGSHKLRLTLSSLASGAGTSFVAVNLARSFAAAGCRTLLVDGDVHRGALHCALDLPRRPGLTDYLIGEVPARQIVQDTATAGISFIACGKRVRDASALLATASLVALLHRLESEYDVVLCDSAPFTAGTDPFVLGARTGHLLVVIRSGVSPRAAAAAAVAMRDRVPVDLLGVVITGTSRTTRDAPSPGSVLPLR